MECLQPRAAARSHQIESTNRFERRRSTLYFDCKSAERHPDFPGQHASVQKWRFCRSDRYQRRLRRSGLFDCGGWRRWIRTASGNSFRSSVRARCAAAVLEVSQESEPLTEAKRKSKKAKLKR